MAFSAMTASVMMNADTFDLRPSQRALEMRDRLLEFMGRHVYPNERRYYLEAERLGPWARYPVVDELKAIARGAGLWNLFLAPEAGEAGFSNIDYAFLCEVMGRSLMAPELFNCSAPDTGNMEVLHRYGTPEQKSRWLAPLLAGEIRSAFAMTEPEVASSDATNIGCRITRDGGDYLINGRKWYTTGATNPSCQLLIVMGKTDPDNPDRHYQQSMILVPRDTPGVSIERAIPIFGFYGVPDRASEVVFGNVRVPAANILLGEGRGFEIAQGRLGPGRLHHCMRLIGLSERILERMCRRAEERRTFGRSLAQHGVTLERIAQGRIAIEQTRLLTLKAARMLDIVGNKVARQEIAMIKVAAPAMAERLINDAIQMFGAGGTANDHFLAAAYSIARALRIADGPDEVHSEQIAKLEQRRVNKLDPAFSGTSASPLELDEMREIAAAGLWPPSVRENSRLAQIQ